ncbi:MAG: MFS transporter [Melioribacteraceae bacterium]|nr:MFS transporter [Melioribacteraceae bacterium]
MNPWKGLKNIPRNVWLISITTLINRSGMMVLPFLALYLTQEMGETPGRAGFVLTVYGLGSLVSAPFTGKLSDKIGAMNLMRVSLFSSGIVLLLFPLFDNYIGILFISLLLSLVTEAFRPASMAFLSDQTEAEMLKPVFAVYRLAINLGMSIGPVAGGILTSIDFDLLFYADGITTLMAGVFLLFAKWEKCEHHSDSKDVIKVKEIVPAFKDGRLLYYLFCLLPVTMVFFQHMSTMPLFLVEELGYARTTFGIFVSVNTVLIIIFEVPLNTYMVNWKNWRLLSIGSLLTGIGFGGLAFFHSLPGIVFTIVVWTFGEMIFFPAASSYIAELAPKGRRGEYMGYFQLLFSTAFTTAPWLGATIFAEFGSFTLWIGTFLFSLISALFILKLRHDKSK